MSSEIYIFAGGGTGGHIYPGLAVADELVRLRPEAKVVFACSNRAIDARILEPVTYAMVPQPVEPLPGNPWRVVRFLMNWRRSMRLAATMLADLKPAAVLGLGGFAAGPIVRTAACCGLRRAMLNPDAVPGRANRYLARFSEAIFTQFDDTRDHFPPSARKKVRAVGVPIRPVTDGSRKEAADYFGLDADRKTLLILGGSQGAATINEAFAALRPKMSSAAGQWQVLHIAGPAQIVEVGADAGALPVIQKNYCKRMDLAYAIADLALCRAGASTVAELAATQTPAVFMPYPYHKDRHQELNAEAMQSSGAAIVCEDARDAAANARLLETELMGLMGDLERLNAMRKATAGLARPGGAAAVAAWLLGDNAVPPSAEAAPGV